MARKGGGISGNKKKRQESQSNGEAYLNYKLIQAERAVLSEKTYDEARDFFCKRGRWVLPLSIPENQFTEIANLVLKRLNREDKHCHFFAEPVSEEEYPDYKNKIDAPMDLSTLQLHVDKGKYGDSSNAAGKFYADILWMFDNSLRFNGPNHDVTKEASRIMKFVPEFFSESLLSQAKKVKKHK